MGEFDPSFLYTIGAGLLGGGIAWGGIVTSLKSVKEEQVEVKSDLAKHSEDDRRIQLDLVNRLARIEGKIDQALGDSKR